MVASDRLPSTPHSMISAANDCLDATGTPLASGSRPVFRLQPLTDPRWEKFLQAHPRASVFHTAQWLDALRRTYGYEPIAITTSPPETDLRNAAVFSLVDSWLTGRRMVSLPFSDHCDLLVEESSDLAAVASYLKDQLGQQRLRYVELRQTRPCYEATPAIHSTITYCLHHIDLTPGIDRLFSNLHKDCIQRKIRRAHREGLTCEEGRSSSLLDDFYRLLILMRRRHRLPPQPRKWFQSLIECFGNALKIRVAFRNRQAVAAVLTLQYKDTILYKYGCSDARFHNLGAMQLLLWNSILEAAQDGLRLFDLGRSGWNDSGLITFKDRWGARRSTLTYVRFLTSARSRAAFAPAGADCQRRAVERLVQHLPEPILESVGSLIYRHFG
jgi:hypothetical protein